MERIELTEAIEFDRKVQERGYNLEALNMLIIQEASPSDLAEIFKDLFFEVSLIISNRFFIENFECDLSGLLWYIKRLHDVFIYMEEYNHHEEREDAGNSQYVQELERQNRELLYELNRERQKAIGKESVNA